LIAVVAFGVGVDEHLVGPPAPGVVALSGREPALEEAGGGDHVGLVQRAGAGHRVAEVPGRPGTEPPHMAR
jgi:hypothetical protein